jgi:hypothetical protein
LRDAIAEWAHPWNLNNWKKDDPWFFDHTLQTLHWWRINQDAHDKLQWYPLSASWELTLDAQMPSQWLPTWEPDTEKQTEYIERVTCAALLQIEDSILSCSDPSSRKAFVDSIEKKAAEYCKRVQAHYGWEKSRKKPEIQKHISWTMRFQVVEESYAGIARSGKTNASHVKREVAEILDILKLIPRKTTPGRKPGQEDDPNSPRQKNKKHWK